MIALLEGTLAEKATDHVVLSVNGVGYEVQVAAGTLAALPPPGKQARLFTRLHVREDAMVLYGFASPDERTLFDHLVSVSGVGP
jgi:Holliday junction DNA helicase RuvA